jgi:hypothetical protein
MGRSEEHERLPEDLDWVADALQRRRLKLEPLELDRIKLRAMSGARRSASSQPKAFSLRSRLVTILTVGMLALGTGSAVAGLFSAGGGVPSSSGSQSAAHHEYKPPCKDDEKFEHGHCVKEKDHEHHRWEHKHGWCWLEDGHGGWTWGYGDGWVYE